MNGSSSSAASMTVETKQATASATNENQLAGVKRIGELDVTKAERKVWLVKIPVRSSVLFLSLFQRVAK